MIKTYKISGKEYQELTTDRNNSGFKLKQTYKSHEKTVEIVYHIDNDIPSIGWDKNDFKRFSVSNNYNSDFWATVEMDKISHNKNGKAIRNEIGFSIDKKQLLWLIENMQKIADTLTD